MEKGDEHSVFHENRKGAKCVPKKQEKSTLSIWGRDKSTMWSTEIVEERSSNIHGTQCDLCKQKGS